ncbi:hypothetical protein SFRURICE_018332 [Spodoptera frugiperda]|nr:hypothetical protein SFRURICE_018332 [Spodoptera frugiperda]
MNKKSRYCVFMHIYKVISSKLSFVLDSWVRVVVFKKMHFNILFFVLILNIIRSSQLLDSDNNYELVPVMNPMAGNAPFFELPCMIVGGTCAKPMYCPDGTRVGTKGLCPVQQPQGMECCRPSTHDITCHSKGGECVSDHYKCPRLLRVKEANDCGAGNTCCAFI